MLHTLQGRRFEALARDVMPGFLPLGCLGIHTILIGFLETWKCNCLLYCRQVVLIIFIVTGTDIITTFITVAALLQLQHYYSCNIMTVATLWQFQHYYSCNIITVTTLWQLQHYYSCNIITVATLLQLQHYDSCNIMTVATLLQLQHYYSYNIITVATLFQLQHYYSCNIITVATLLATEDKIHARTFSWYRLPLNCCSVYTAKMLKGLNH